MCSHRNGVYYSRFTELKSDASCFSVGMSESMSVFLEGIDFFSSSLSRTPHQGQTEGERKGERTSAGEGKEKRKG